MRGPRMKPHYASPPHPQRFARRLSPPGRGKKEPALDATAARDERNAMGEGVRLWLALAALNGFLAVAAGAFGAHAVSDPQAKEWLRTGAQYQAIHAVAALACFGLLRLAVGPA